MAADYTSRETVDVNNLDHDSLCEVLRLLLERLNLEVEKVTEIYHGDEPRHSYLLKPTK